MFHIVYCRCQLFKRWITLYPSRQNIIQWIVQLVFLINTYPLNLVNSVVIHLLNNQELLCSTWVTMVVGKRVLIVSSKLIDLLQKEHISWVKMVFFFQRKYCTRVNWPPHSLPLPTDCHLQAPASWPPRPPPPPYSLRNEREIKKQTKILELKKVNERIHQPRKKCLIIQTHGISHYMK